MSEDGGTSQVVGEHPCPLVSALVETWQSSKGGIIRSEFSAKLFQLQAPAADRVHLGLQQL